jgi:hypothetical protein
MDDMRLLSTEAEGVHEAIPEEHRRPLVNGANRVGALLGLRPPEAPASSGGGRLGPPPPSIGEGCLWLFLFMSWNWLIPALTWGVVFLLALSKLNTAFSFPPSGIVDGYELSQHCDEFYVACDPRSLVMRFYALSHVEASI